MKKLYPFKRSNYVNSTPTDGLSADERADFIDQTIWSREFSWPEIQVLGQYVRAFKADTGSALISEGERERYLCIVVKGYVEVWKKSQTKKDKLLSTITAGRTFGEMALIDDEPRSASVVAGEPAVLIVMRKEQFNNLCEEHPKVANKILYRISRLISQRLRKASGTLVDLLGG